MSIHRFWMGREMPVEYQDFERQWRVLNPGEQVLTWDLNVLTELPEHLDAVVKDIIRRDAGRKGIEMYVQIADVVGYYLVWRYGGTYVNCDMEPVAPLHPLPALAWASYENDVDGRIVNAAIGAPEPNDVFWGSLLEVLPERYFANPTDEMVMTTGPALLTDHAHAHPDLIHVLPRETFNPVHWKEISPGGDASAWRQNLPSLTIALHHWGHKKDGRSNTVETATQ